MMRKYFGIILSVAIGVLLLVSSTDLISQEEKLVIFAGKKFNVFFGEDSTHITLETAELLDKLVAFGKKNKSQKLLVSGFFHEYETEGLAEKRAEAVKEYCVMLGLPAAQIRTRFERRPILAQHEEGIFQDDERARARRVELVFIDAPPSDSKN